MKNVLIIGASGQIGSNLFNFLKKKKCNVIGTSRSKKKNLVKLDLNWALSRWPNLKNISVIIFCAGITNIIQCEKKKKISKKINIEGLKKVIIKYKEKKTKLIFISSTSVFNGRRAFYKINSRTSPINSYGKQKTISEKIILKNNGLVIRAAKLVNTLENLINKWKKNINKKKIIHPFDKIHTSLITIKNIQDIIYQSIKKNKKGVMHLSSSDEISYKKIALIMCKKFNKQKNLIKEKKRPKSLVNILSTHSSLANNKFIKVNTRITKSEIVFKKYINKFK